MTISLQSSAQTYVDRYYAVTVNEMVMSADERNVRKVYETLREAWSNNDKALFTSCFTDDCDFVNFQNQVSGCSGASAKYDKLLNHNDDGTTLSADISKVKILNNNTAIVHVKLALYNRWQAKVASSTYAYHTHALILQDGEWKITSLHNNVTPKPGFFKRLFSALF